jgi:hypothetical protein
MQPAGALRLEVDDGPARCAATGVLEPVSLSAARRHPVSR